MNFKEILVEIFIELRGDQSRRSLNQLLGYSYDRITVWENESSSVDWCDFARYMDVLKAPLKEALSRNLAYYGEVDNGGEIVRFILGNRSYDTAGDICGIPAYRLRRVATSHSPKVHEIFSMIANLITKEQFLAFIIHLAGRDLPFLQYYFNQSQQYYDLVGTNPLYTFLPMLLSHSDITLKGANSVEFVVSQTGLSRELIQSSLDDLLAINVVKIENGDYRANKEVSFIGKTRDQGIVSSRTHVNLFSKVIAQELDEMERVQHGYASFIISQPALKEMMRETSRYMANLNRIVAEDKDKKETIVSLVTGMFDPTKFLG